MGKSNRHGQAASLSPTQLDQIMAECPPPLLAVLSICRFTACRISESLQLKFENVLADSVVFPRSITKKKMATRTVPISAKLEPILNRWRVEWPNVYGRGPLKTDYLFPAPRDINKYWARPRVDEGLRAACRKVGLEGVSTHSFRRSALTQASAAGVSTRLLQSLSGHSSLDQLQRYIDVTDEQKKKAVMSGFG